MSFTGLVDRVGFVAKHAGYLGDSKALFPHLAADTSYVFSANDHFKDEDLRHFIDHTLLKPQSTEPEILQICKEAIEHQFKAVCVNGSNASLVQHFIQDNTPATQPKPALAVVVGFPLGSSTSHIKILEAQEAVKLGASEIDMVINVGWLKEGPQKYKNIYDEIAGIATAVGDQVALKVILETCLLTEAEIVDACIICVLAKASFVKTSTGFSTGGATLEAVKAMRNVVGDRLGVKASGGIRSLEDARAMIKAGASRLGTSSGVALVKGLKATSTY